MKVHRLEVSFLYGGAEETVYFMYIHSWFHIFCVVVCLGVLSVRRGGQWESVLLLRSSVPEL